MSTDAVPFTIRHERHSAAKCLYLYYEEPGHQLDLFFELTGFGVPYSWVGGTEAFDTWTRPAGQPVAPAYRTELRRRVEAYAAAQRLSIGFAPPLGFAAEEGPLRAAGYTPTPLPDGSVRWDPPPRAGWFAWVRRLFGP